MQRRTAGQGAGGEATPGIGRWVAAAIGLMLLGVPAGSARAQAPDACEACARDEIRFLHRIEGHPVFDSEQLLQETCGAIEYPNPKLKVAADGTRTSIVEVQHVIDTPCISFLSEPTPRFLDENYQVVLVPDPAVYGSFEVEESTDEFVRFVYTHPTQSPPDGETFRTIRIAIFYDSSQVPEPLRRSVLEIRVHRPPVLFAHGLWSDASGFAAMDAAFAGDHYTAAQLFRLDYAETNDAYFDTNAPKVADGIDALIQQSADDDLSAGKVDLVGHSMGGILSRLYVQNADYPSRDDVRRIVTANTPHAGSQMANLLLDRNADPLGLQCDLIGGLLSLMGFPERSCVSGAVEDLRVDSGAIFALNQSLHPSSVDVHALATVFDPNDLPTIVGIGPLSTLLAVNLRRCGTTAVAQVFGQDDHDVVVSATSQAGGLSGLQTSLHPNIWHVGSVAKPVVIDEVKGLLQEPVPSSRFNSAGYAPAPLSYTPPPACFAGVSGGAAAARSSGGAEGIARPRNGGADLSIVSPASGSAFAPGDALLVEVTGSPDVVAVQVAAGQSADALVFAEATGTPPSAALEIPDTANGAMNVLATGFDASGALIAVSEPVAIDVVVPAELEAITVYPAAVYLQPCDRASLEISGHYADAVVRSLGAVPGLTFAFADGYAERSSARGVQLLQAPGDTLTVSIGEVASEPIAIRALPGADPPGGVCPVPEPGAAATGLAAMVALAGLGRRRSVATNS